METHTVDSELLEHQGLAVDLTALEVRHTVLRDLSQLEALQRQILQLQQLLPHEEHTRVERLLLLQLETLLPLQHQELERLIRTQETVARELLQLEVHQEQHHLQERLEPLERRQLGLQLLQEVAQLEAPLHEVVLEVHLLEAIHQREARLEVLQLEATRQREVLLLQQEVVRLGALQLEAARRQEAVLLQEVVVTSKN